MAYNTMDSNFSNSLEDAICCYVIYYYCVCLFGTMISVIYDLRDYYVCLFGTKF